MEYNTTHGSQGKPEFHHRTGVRDSVWVWVPQTGLHRKLREILQPAVRSSQSVSIPPVEFSAFPLSHAAGLNRTLKTGWTGANAAFKTNVP